VGHVTGGRVFGYDNVRVNGHVERRINDEQAEVVREIYRRYAAGEGFKQIAHVLNANKVPSPRPQQGRPAGWEPSTVRSVLLREIYRGVLVYNRTKKRRDDGSRGGRQRQKRQEEWIRVEAAELRIVEAQVADAVDRRLGGRRHAYLRGAKGRLLGRPVEGKRLLSGFIVCECGARFEAAKNWRGEQVYVCSARRRKGPAVCASDSEMCVDDIENVFLDCLEREVLCQEFIERLLDSAFTNDRGSEREALAEERSRLKSEIANLTKGIAAGGDIPALAEALSERDRSLKRIDATLAAPVAMLDRDALRAALELRRGEWRELLRGPHVQQGRLILQHLIELPIRVENEPIPKFMKRGDERGQLKWKDGRWVNADESKWSAKTRPGGMLVGLIQNVASPTGFEPVFWP
jgi:hypothetical protein